MRGRAGVRLAGGVVVCVVGVLGFSGSALAALETPVVGAPTSITGDSAVLHGELNPGGPGEAGEYQFLYKVSTEACRPETEHNPEPPAAAAGAAKEAVQVEATDLEPGATYEVCVIELHEGGGEVESASRSFTTLSKAAPLLLGGSSAAVGVTPFAATLSAQINPEKEATEYSFEYATNEALTENKKTIAGTEPLPPEFGFREASVSTNNVLSAGTTYFFRVVAKNGTGTTTGPVVEFTTRAAEAPVVGSETVSGLNTTEPRFEAKVNPNYQATQYFFEYALSEQTVTEGKGTPVAGSPPAPALPAVFEELLAGPDVVSGLSPGPEYFYRVVASNSTGVTDGPVQSFIAEAAPAVTTGASGGVSRTAARVNGAIVPDGLPSTYRFEYIDQAGYEKALSEDASDPYSQGRSTYETALEGSDYTSHPVSVTLEELAPGTVYHYALVSSNEIGSQTGADETFTTSPGTAPAVTTGSASGVGQLTATITGTVNTNGLQTTVSFELARSGAPAAIIPAELSQESGGILPAAASLTNLLPGTTYFYRVIASNRDGSTQGAQQSFTTSVFPPVLSVPATPAPLVFPTITQLDAKETAETPKPHTPALTRKQKLARALKACQHKPPHQRPNCRHQAHHKYPPPKHH